MQGYNNIMISRRDINVDEKGLRDNHTVCKTTCLSGFCIRSNSLNVCVKKYKGMLFIRLYNE